MPPIKGGFCVFMGDFNIHAQLFLELDDYFRNKIFIAGTQNQEGARFLSQQNSGYHFSQWETLNRIELYYNSKFESGDLDSEGQKKLFLNICKFRTLVAAKQTDLDVKDFVFIPDDYGSVWGAYFMNKRFRQWAKSNYFGELINQLNFDRPKYGSTVLKRVGSKLERVPLLTIRNQQDAKSLKTAKYVIEEHKDMAYEDMSAMKEWNLEGISLDFGQKATVYERYGRVPLSFYNKSKGDYEGNSKNETVDCLSILTLDVEDKKLSKYGGSVLFIEKVGERPYEESHWEKQDGRWLGVGEVENQFENQVARNTSSNLRRRALLWSSKRIFQSADTELAKNLVRDVKDGDVLRIMPNGTVTQVDMNTRNLAEFQQMDNMWEQNSDQKSFTFEVATGESLPSGTPFRLGVVLSNSVNSHFALKREDFGLFFNRVIDNLVLPIFKKENRKEHTVNLLANEEGVENLKEALIRLHVTQEAKKLLFRGNWPDVATIEQKVRDDIQSRDSLFMDMSALFYDDVKATTQFVITGEQVDLQKRIETLTNIYNTMVQKGDQRADRVLKSITALTGENYDALAGVKQSAQSMPQMQGQNMQQMMATATAQPQPNAL